MAHAAITGASGLLGSNLAAELVADGHTVTALRRSGTDTTALDDLSVDWVQADLTSPAQLRRAFDGADVVFHCAAAVSTGRRITPTIANTNIVGTRAVIAAAVDCGTPRLVHTSTVQTFGPTLDGSAADERTPWAMDLFDFDNAYAVTKHLAEQLVDRAGDRLDAVVVHPGYLIGPRDARPSSGRMILEVVHGRVPFWTPGYNNFADVRSVARGMIAAWHDGRRGEHYILGGQELTYREFLQRVAVQAGVRPPRFRLPRSLAVLGGKAGDLAETLTHRESAVNSYTVRYAFTEHYRYRSDKAIAELGYTPAPIEPAIDAALAWFAAHGMIRRG